MIPTELKAKPSRLFHRQISGLSCDTNGSTASTTDSPKSSSSSICSFILFEFYGISLQTEQKQQWDSNEHNNGGNWTMIRLIVLWLARAVTIGSMFFLLAGTGESAFSKDSSAEVITNHTRKPIPALSSLNLKFYYRLSFHLKCYFCIVSYFYVLIRIKEIRRVMMDIMNRLTGEGDIRRVVRVRRLLLAVWLVNVLANAAFFVWVDIDIELHDVLSTTSISEHKQTAIGQISLALMKEILWAIYGFGWLINGVLFMILICYANYLVERDVLGEQMHLSAVKSVLLYPNLLATSKDQFNINMAIQLDIALHRQYGTLATVPRRTLIKLYSALQTLTCLQEQVNHHLGLLPFFWLCELFLSTCLRITQVALLAGVRPSGNTLQRVDKSIKLQIEYHLEYFVEYLVLTVFYIGFIAIVEYFASQRVSMFQLERSLLESVESETKLIGGLAYADGNSFNNKQSNHYTPRGVVGQSGLGTGRGGERHLLTNFTLVMLTIAVSNKYIKSRYMAWCKFNLNYRLVFAFINAAAPFSVMILQLHG